MAETAENLQRQTLNDLLNLCENRGISTTRPYTKERLVRALLEHDGEEQNPILASDGDLHASEEELSNLPPDEDLQILGSDNPALQLDIFKLQQAERQAERQAAREERERQAAREAEERQAAREERERQAAREAADKQADREYQLELAKLRLQNGSAAPTESRGERVVKVSLDKFPTMDKDGDVDTFLQGFERTCRQYALPKEEWAKYLTPKLTDKALKAFVSLSEDQGGDYEAIKEAIVKRYHLTPEVYRKRFRTMQRGSNDSYMDLACNLRTAFQQWLKGLSVSTFATLQELMIKDQFLYNCPTEVRQFVLDREPETADHAAEIADSYAANRGFDTRRTTAPSWREGKPTRNVGDSYIICNQLLWVTTLQLV